MDITTQTSDAASWMDGSPSNKIYIRQDQTEVLASCKVKLTEVKLGGYGKVVLKSPLTGKRHWFHAKESLFEQFEACAFDFTEPRLII